MANGVKTGGRKKGTQNKITRDLKEMVMGALDKAGGAAYLLAQAKDNPNAFLTLVGKFATQDIKVAGALGTYTAREIPIEPRDLDPLEKPAGTAAGSDTKSLH